MKDKFQGKSADRCETLMGWFTKAKEKSLGKLRNAIHLFNNLGFGKRPVSHIIRPLGDYIRKSTGGTDLVGF